MTASESSKDVSLFDRPIMTYTTYTAEKFSTSVLDDRPGLSRIMRSWIATSPS